MRDKGDPMTDRMTALIVLALVAVISIICYFRIFEKMRLSGYLALIPVYGPYRLYRRIFTVNAFFTGLVAAGIMALSIVIMYNHIDGAIFGIEKDEVCVMCSLVIFGLAAVVIAVIYVMRNIRLARAFGKGALFAVGLCLLPPVFLGILAFGDSRYIKKRKTSGREEEK